MTNNSSFSIETLLQIKPTTSSSSQQEEQENDSTFTSNKPVAMSLAERLAGIYYSSHWPYQNFEKKLIVLGFFVQGHSLTQ